MLSTVFAAVGDTPYNIVLILHILTAMAAFAPAVVHPLLVNQSKAMPADGRQTVLGYMIANGRRIYSPALILTGLLGFALSGMSSNAYELSQTWLIVSIILWIAMNGLLHAVVFPAEKALASGDESAQQRMDIGGMAITLLLVVMLYLMVFKPGL